MKKISKLVAAIAMAATAFSSQAATFVGDRTDFRDETIYFAMTTRFYDGDPTNNVCAWDKQDVQKSKNDPDWRGDFAGLIDKLDYIKALGFTAIWITPIVQNASGEDYHGYHAMDFGNVDLRYESRKEWGATKDVKFKDLIKAAHDKGLKIVLDVVLQHTGNFGEVYLNPLFTRSQDIRNQASVPASMIPNYDRLPSNYNDLNGAAQYAARFKYFKNPTGDPHNYYHHYGTGWNWDLPNRWWGQIAGDCVDLNTENNTVAEYIVKCYGEFIKLGVDGFRIDTTGHIAPLTFNKQFIPQFLALGEQYKSERLNGCPFFMFGECCARYGSVVYRDQHNLSSHFYTWKSPQNLLDQYDGSQAYWDTQSLNEGHDSPVGPMILCEQDKEFNHSSDNVFMKNGAWHEPNYSEYSGFSVIDFPMHYNFNSAGQAINIAKEGDKYYNDASFNVVYVDSHDYCPGPNDGTRFNGGTAQWAENLSLMFTFRGIPCIYYGSEVEFKKGKPIDVGGDNNKTPRSESGRAYFGNYLEGSVTATDFGQYTASGNVAQTLNADLAHHVRRLNQIRAAVPALRKGQYTFDGCQANGGYAFKRATKDSYALVAINGGATFTGVPSGNYVEIVTGKSYSPVNGTISVDAPKTKGQLRVLVKGWTGSKVGEDGKFIYDSQSQARGGSVEFADPGASRYYTAEDAIGNPQVKFSPAGGSFRTETVTVTATANEATESAWYQVDGQAKVTLTTGQSGSFTIGQGMAYGETKSVTWSATGGGKTYNGTVTYKKVDPNAGVTVYVTAAEGKSIDGANMYAWNDGGKLLGDWPGKSVKSMSSLVSGGRTYYYYAFDVESLNVIFNQTGQTGDLNGIDHDICYEYDGANYAKEIPLPGNEDGPTKPSIRANPASGATFSETLAVTLTATPATDIYYTLNGSQASASSTKYTGPITLNATTTINAYAKNEVGETHAVFTYTKQQGVAPIDGSWHVYFKNDQNWSDVYVYSWDDNHKEDNAFSGKWPGKKLTDKVTYNGQELYHFTFTPDNEPSNPMIIFSNGNGDQSSDHVLKNYGMYTKGGWYDSYVSGMIGFNAGNMLEVYARNGQIVINAAEDCSVQVVNLNGTVRILNVAAGHNAFDFEKGFYVVAGKKLVL